MAASTIRDDDETPCDDSGSLWPMLLAAGSTLLVGYVAGRVSFAMDVRKAMRRIEESPEPIEILVRPLAL